MYNVDVDVDVDVDKKTTTSSSTKKTSEKINLEIKNFYVKKRSKNRSKKRSKKMTLTSASEIFFREKFSLKKFFSWVQKKRPRQKAKPDRKKLGERGRGKKKRSNLPSLLFCVFE